MFKEGLTIAELIFTSAVMTDDDEKAVSAVIVALRMFVFIYD